MSNINKVAIPIQPRHNRPPLIQKGHISAECFWRTAAVVALDGPIVAKLTVVVAELLFDRFTEAGLTEHVIPIMTGAAQDKVTVLLKLVVGAMVTVMEPV
jgi:hypothetical protein